MYIASELFNRSKTQILYSLLTCFHIRMPKQCHHHNIYNKNVEFAKNCINKMEIYLSKWIFFLFLLLLKANVMILFRFFPHSNFFLVIFVQKTSILISISHFCHFKSKFMDFIFFLLICLYFRMIYIFIYLFLLNNLLK